MIHDVLLREFNRMIFIYCAPRGGLTAGGILDPRYGVQNTYLTHG